MKAVVILLAATAGLAVAQPHQHNHRHRHVEKRDPSPVVDWVNVPGPTVVVYELNGQPISESAVEEGIANGTLVWAGDGGLASASDIASSTSTPSSSSTPTPSSTWVPPTSSSQPSTTADSSTSSSQAPSSSSSSSQAAASSSSTSGSGLSGGNGVDKDFPDGELDCSTFPSDYGAIALDWLNLGGWSGIQVPGSLSAAFDDIKTIVGGSVSDGSYCSEGAYCSYACPAGYQKLQWPSTQGATGQSVGGITCSGGKLHKTNSDASTLCGRGTDKVTVMVQNKLSELVSTCRTDYPGTEDETIPVEVAAGAESEFACPDSSTYYFWEGKGTSAQIYVNPAGVSAQDGCNWGTSGKDWGNYAPLNLGVGYSAGNGWLSIFQNSPTTDAKLDFNVEIVGDNVVGSCKYDASKKQYCSAAGCNDQGCTVSIASGTATYVFS